jgi:hypothetical protein
MTYTLADIQSKFTFSNDDPNHAEEAKIRSAIIDMWHVKENAGDDATACGLFFDLLAAYPYSINFHGTTNQGFSADPPNHEVFYDIYYGNTHKLISSGGEVFNFSFKVAIAHEIVHLLYNNPDDIPNFENYTTVGQNYVGEIVPFEQAIAR